MVEPHPAGGQPAPPAAVPWQLVLLEQIERVATADPAVAQLRVTGSAAGGAAELDGWSDLDVALAVRPTAIDRIGGPGWSGRFGRQWAVSVSRTPGQIVRRTVYDDGRRLDLVVLTETSRLSAGRTVLGPRATRAEPPAPPPPDYPPDSDLDTIRFTAALAVVKLARGDLLIGTHLALEVVRCCLVQGMRLRDHDLGTTTHRHGSDRDQTVAELDHLRRHPWTVAGGLALIADATRAYDRLTAELHPGYQSDWSGLHALLQQATHQ